MDPRGGEFDTATRNPTAVERRVREIIHDCLSSQVLPVISHDSRVVASLYVYEDYGQRLCEG